MSGQFEGKTAIVTGGASGIGAAISRELAAGGATVIIADRDTAGLDAIVGEIAAAGGKALSYELNVADAMEVEALVAFAEHNCGGLHLAVNNAGIAGPSAPTADYPLDSWRQVMDVNLNSVFFCMKYEIAAMQRSGGGAIVNMSSILGSVGFANAPAYVAAKHGLVGLTKVAAMEYAKHAIRVNAVGPGFIDTPLLPKNLDEPTLQVIAGLHPIGRLGRAEEVSALTCFLLSDRASFITGSYHLVDGGYGAQ
jgi:NAD(P)-dependent dehydrogenase (short-subunit alcohol dehydrogenase family)